MPVSHFHRLSIARYSPLHRFDGLQRHLSSNRITATMPPGLLDRTKGRAHIDGYFFGRNSIRLRYITYVQVRFFDSPMRWVSQRRIALICQPDCNPFHHLIKR